MKLPKFSHQSQYTIYMKIIHKDIATSKKPLKILDIPAGNGLFADGLRKLGHEVICADINNERACYKHVNMEFPLPYKKDTFDATVCMEGIEHVINQRQLLSELVRVTKPGGKIYISTPNIGCLWSKCVTFICNYFYQFAPTLSRIGNEQADFDKGHISPISLYDLGYLMAVRKARLIYATADRFKKAAIVWPLLIFYPLSWYISLKIHRKLDAKWFDKKGKWPSYFNIKVFTGRSLITVFRKAYDQL